MSGTCDVTGCTRDAYAAFRKRIDWFAEIKTVDVDILHCKQHTAIMEAYGACPIRYLRPATKVFRADGKRILVKGKPRISDDEIRQRVRSAIALREADSAQAVHRALQDDGYAVERSRVSEAWKTEWAARAWVS